MLKAGFWGILSLTLQPRNPRAWDRDDLEELGLVRLVWVGPRYRGPYTPGQGSKQGGLCIMVSWGAGGLPCLGEGLREHEAGWSCQGMRASWAPEAGSLCGLPALSPERQCLGQLCPLPALCPRALTVMQGCCDSLSSLKICQPRQTN